MAFGTLQLSKAFALAVHLLVRLAESEGRPVSTVELAASLEASRDHLLKVAQRLARSGLVLAQRGPAGGLFLARDPEAVSLLEVYEAVEGPLTPYLCALRSRPCGRQPCVFGNFLPEFSQQLRSFLAGTSIAQLARRSATAQGQPGG